MNKHLFFYAEYIFTFVFVGIGILTCRQVHAYTEVSLWFENHENNTAIQTKTNLEESPLIDLEATCP